MGRHKAVLQEKLRIALLPRVAVYTEALVQALMAGMNAGDCPYCPANQCTKHRSVKCHREDVAIAYQLHVEGPEV